MGSATGWNGDGSVWVHLERSKEGSAAMWMRKSVIAGILLAASAGLPLAQEAAPDQAPGAPEHDGHPCAPGTRAPGQGSLSEKLDDCSGVLRPSVGMDPGIQKPPPDSSSDMPIIKPDTGAKPE